MVIHLHKFGPYLHNNVYCLVLVKIYGRLLLKKTLKYHLFQQTRTPITQGLVIVNLVKIGPVDLKMNIRKSSEYIFTMSLSIIKKAYPFL